MKWFYALLLATVSAAPALSQEIVPSKKNIPNQFINPPGKRFSIFSGDPERVQRANEIDLKDFKGEAAVTPASISIIPSAAADAPTTLKVTFRVKNTSAKKGYTLSFPDSQRFDIAVSAGPNSMIYLWSDDKIFEQKVGASFLNPGETLTWIENIPLEKITRNATPGTYEIKVILANYPEISATARLTVTP